MCVCVHLCPGVSRFLTACFPSEPATVYEMKLVAFNGNGEGEGSRRLVSLGDEATSSSSDGEPPGRRGDSDLQKSRLRLSRKPKRTATALICVSLMSAEKRACQCGEGEEASLGSVVIGIHIGTACIIFCVLFLVFGYRHR